MTTKINNTIIDNSVNSRAASYESIAYTYKGLKKYLPLEGINSTVAKDEADDTTAIVNSNAIPFHSDLDMVPTTADRKMNMKSHIITNLANATSSTDAITLGQANKLYVPKGYVTEYIEAETESDLDFNLSYIYNTMANNTEYRIYVKPLTATFFGGATAFCTIRRTDANYGTATFTFYGVPASGIGKCTKNYYAGSWTPIQWDNPLMILNTPYCTTERYNNQKVYTELVNCGAAANGKSVTINHGTVIRHNGNLNMNHSLPFYVAGNASASYWAESRNEGGKLTLSCGNGFAANNYTWYEQVWWII